MIVAISHPIFLLLIIISLISRKVDYKIDAIILTKLKVKKNSIFTLTFYTKC